MGNLLNWEFAQLGITQLRVDQLGIVHLGIAHLGIANFGIAHLGAGHLGVNQVHLEKMNFYPPDQGLKLFEMDLLMCDNFLNVHFTFRKINCGRCPIAKDCQFWRSVVHSSFGCFVVSLDPVLMGG
uniref:Uncharacterized protein n=1 Tax=Romanomermis culicivorax TaxID=13658 RepID=A0A915IDF6_ROMCU